MTDSIPTSDEVAGEVSVGRGEAADRRDSVAEQRDEAADARDSVADLREDDANERERVADNRQDSADRHEFEMDRHTEQTDEPVRFFGASPAVVSEPQPQQRLTSVPRTPDQIKDLLVRRSDATARRGALADRATASDARDVESAERVRVQSVRALNADSDAVAASQAGFADQLGTREDFGWAILQLEPSRYLHISAGARAILGLDRSINIPIVENIRLIVHPDDIAPVLSGFLRQIAKGRTTEAELRIVRSDGVTRWIHVSSYPIDGGRVGHARSAQTVEDITDRKDTEMIAYVRMIEAERAVAARSQFLTSMTHELRTPLNAVLGFAQLFEMDPMSEAQEKAVGFVLSAGHHLLDMINDVLDSAQVENGEVNILLQAVSVQELLADTVGLMLPIAAARDVHITCDSSAPAAFSHVLADPRRLRQVLLNLLSNAVKYNNPGGTVEVSVIAAEDDLLQIAVADTGLGIEAADLHRLFVPFERVGQQDSGIEGTGMGLYVTKRLLGEMGCTIDVRSEYGQGSTFSVTVPLAIPNAAETPELATST
jgi:PAS domain S-box-containing protein